MAKASGANWGTLIPRFLLCVVFVYHGGRALFGLFGGTGVDPFPGWTGTGMPARAVAATLFFGGLCLGIGLMTRAWAAGLAAVMALTAWKFRLAHGFAEGDGGWEYQFVLGILALSLVVQGGGAFSLDEMFFKGRKPAAPKPEG
jgi:putative oxidoreductase